MTLGQLIATGIVGGAASLVGMLAKNSRIGIAGWLLNRKVKAAEELQDELQSAIDAGIAEALEAKNWDE